MQMRRKKPAHLFNVRLGFFEFFALLFFVSDGSVRSRDGTTKGNC